MASKRTRRALSDETAGVKISLSHHREYLPGHKQPVAPWSFSRRALMLCVALLALVVLSANSLRLFERLGTSGKPGQNHPSTSSLALSTMQDVELDPRPVQRLPSGKLDETYMAYFPHSGYHNQRISLENALVVAHMLGRTLLVPPVWLGHAIPFISFDKMYDRLLQARKTGLMHCKNMSSNLPIPQECLADYWDYTVVSWDFLVDLERIAKVQPLVERWDTSYSWMKENLGIDASKDTYYLKDERLYDYKIYDSLEDSEPLGKFTGRLDIDTLRKASADHKLVHFGTLFGSTRLRLTKPENKEIQTLARQSMIFRHPILDNLTDLVRDRLGGSNAYLSVHFRLGDGVFQQNALSNSKKLFMSLCKSKLGLATVTCERLHRDNSHVEDAERREVKEGEEEELAVSASPAPPTNTSLAKRYSVKDPHHSLQPLILASKRENMLLHDSLRCRRPLHTDPKLVVLNTPIYLATDSRIPTSDPALAVFYNTFPCIFSLNDITTNIATKINIEPIPGFAQLQYLKNKEDGVHLAQFFYPFMDAMIAAKGRDIVGTSGSTFSKFAVDVLHPTYHGWPISDRP